jgi:hypothetical protein
MTQLSTFEMVNTAAGSAQEVISDVCAVVVAGEGIYWIGIAASWWNPVGWLSGVLAGVSGACGLYTIGTAIADAVR